MRIGLILLPLLLLSAASILHAQTKVSDPLPMPDGVEQSEAMRETLKRMQIQREEEDFARMVERGRQLREKVEEFVKSLAGDAPIEGSTVSRSVPSRQPSRVRLPQQTEKLLREMEKLARQIRSESGGSSQEESLLIPATVAEAVEQLVEASTRLNEALAKTSRRVVSVKVIEAATKVIELTRHLRSHLA
jgi:hypothetical protein